MDGEFLKSNDARVSVLSHALHYGTGVFEGIRAYHRSDNVYVFRLKEHMERLKDSAKIYFMDLKNSVEDLCSATVESIARNEMRCQTYIRPIVFKGFGGIDLNPTKAPTHVAICPFKFESYFENQKSGLDICVSSWRRISDVSTPPMAKACGHYLNSVVAKVEANLNGYDEAILLDSNGFVSEGTGENIFVVEDGKLVTPPLSASILNGVTRDTVMKLASEMCLQVVERNIARAELYTCDEAFFTGTAVEIMPILSIDRRQIGDGKMGALTGRIKAFYNKVIEGNVEKYNSWLTPVYTSPAKEAGSEPAIATVSGWTPKADPVKEKFVMSFWNETLPQW
jgi:branched-chain amino acid aminotransferase